MLRDGTQKLGKGLSALLGDTACERVGNDEKTLGIDLEHVSDIMLDTIKLGKYQPRQNFDETEIDNLAKSIQENGLLQPILVRRISENDYELIAGERRWHAMKALGFLTIPSIIKDFSEKESLSVALVENIQRENLLPLEEACALDRLIVSLGYTQEEVGISIGKSRSYVSNSLRLLQLPDFVMEDLKQNKLSAGHARALLGLDPTLTKEILLDIKNNRLNVRQVELLVRSKKKSGGLERRKTMKQKTHYVSDEEVMERAMLDEDALTLTTHIEAKLGLKVSLNLSQGVGDIVLKVPNLETLDLFMEKISTIGR